MCRSAVEAEEEMQALRIQLKEREMQVQQAAQAGLDLLNQQMELQSRLEEQRVEMTNALEAREQEKYSLQKEIELKTRMMESLKSDYDLFQSQQSQKLQEELEVLERKHSLTVCELNNKVLCLQSSLEESQLSEKQLKHKLQVQTEVLNSKTEELRTLGEQTQNSMTSDMMEVETKLLDLKNENLHLEKSLQESQYREQQLEQTIASLQRHLANITEEKEDREKEAVSYFNALEKSREGNRDLQIQLDLVTQQAQDPNSKGNSLFAELEDKRAEMERQLISMKVQHQSLLKQHAFSKQQQQRMKVQIANLMQLLGTRTDPAQMERLQFMLSEKNGEIQNLMTKLQRLEKVETMLKSQPTNPSAPGCSDVHDETYYTDLLKMQLGKAAKHAENLGDELSLQRMKSLSESQRALQLERKLFKSEQILKQTQSDKIRLQLRVEELQQKYEPKDEQSLRSQKRTKEKLPFSVVPPAKENSPDNEKATVMEINVLKIKAAESGPDICPATQTFRDTKDLISEPRPAKCVRISDESTIIPDQSSHVADSNKLKERQEPNILEESKMELKLSQEDRNLEHNQLKRGKLPVEAIHVSSSSSMENQCAQQ
ncbi:protein Spindly [Synchiropus splendidus]|uniref:protein Spindly n=1 Tax=Synchiropus splendidus TaxID=270530 RepID=UPI00237E5988|nr:protein Spindly [Synchiropus splendidus]XP_053735469.1 protein Spindly [Synchiropus splendidus]XP_053735471.1 protein Spindly [Synchiropus splendidus]